MKKAPFQPTSSRGRHHWKRKNRPSPQWTPAVDQSTSRDIATGCVAARRTRVGRALAQAVGLTLVHAKGLAPPSEYAARGLIVIIVNFVCVTRQLLSVATDEKSTFAFTISAGWGLAICPNPSSDYEYFTLSQQREQGQKSHFCEDCWHPVCYVASSRNPCVLSQDADCPPDDPPTGRGQFMNCPLPAFQQRVFRFPCGYIRVSPSGPARCFDKRPGYHVPASESDGELGLRPDVPVLPWGVPDCRE